MENELDQNPKTEKLVAEFSINGLPKMINAIGRQHWAIKVKEIKRWKSLVGAQVLKARVAQLELDRAVLTLTRHSSAEPDTDGLISGFKCVIDALVTTRVIKDDKPSNIGIPNYRWEKAQKGKGFITIRIERP